MSLAGSKNVWIYVLFLSIISIGCQKQEIVSKETPDPSPLRTKFITILGSSTSEGIGAKPIDSSWANKLKYQLLNDSIDAKVINLGIGGFTTYNILPSTHSTADTARNINKALSYSPDLIIINLPTNDIAKGYSDQETIDNYALVVKEILASKTKFIITSTQPRNFSTIGMRRRLALFNIKLKAIYPGHIVEIYESLATPEFYINPQYGTGDGIHLNNKGHDIIFKAVLKDSVLRTVLY